jgi:uncharacterized protein YijF (DUF1287 family)
MPSPTKFQELTRDCQPGQPVRWRTLGGVVHEGVLVEWDNGTAVVLKPDGSTVSVRAD